MASNGTNSNTEFELRGFNHLALVARDMAETVAWYEDVLGMKLVKTLELPGGSGQHFFLDMGNGVDGIAFFYFPNAPEGVKGESLQNRFGVTAVGTMNHLAFDVDPAKFDEYRQKLIDKGVEVTMVINHCDSLDGGHKEHYDPETDDGDVFVRSDVLHRSQRHAARVRVLDEDLRRERRQARTGDGAHARRSLILRAAPTVRRARTGFLEHAAGGRGKMRPA